MTPGFTATPTEGEVALALDILSRVQSGPASPVRPPDHNLVEQIETLYADREQLEQALGTSEPRRIVERIGSLESQLQTVSTSLAALGRSLGNADLIDFIRRTESTIENLTAQLHDMYGAREGGEQIGGSDVNESLVEQLHTLYAEREGGADVNESLVEQLHTLYAEREGGADVNESLVEQLHTLYAEREGGADVNESLVEQLHTLYAERELTGPSGAAILESLVEQLHTLYAEREQSGDDSRAATIESLSTQLEALYHDRELLQHCFGSAQAEDIAVRVLDREDGFVEQLHAVYAEREEQAKAFGDRDPADIIAAHQATIDNLVVQVESLYRDRENVYEPSRLELLAVQESLLAQLCALYAEREGLPPPAVVRNPIEELRSRFLGS